MKPLNPTTPGAAAPDARALVETHARLRHMSKELEGLFVRQLFQAMRDSVPKEGSPADGGAEQTYTSMLDDALASLASQRMDRGLGEALYRQLSRHLPPVPTTEGESP